MNQAHSSERAALAERSERLHIHNQRYLDRLKESGDPADGRSRMLAAILDCIADGLIVLDEKKTIVLANLAGADLAGWDIEDVSREELHEHYQFFSDEGKTPLPHDQEPIAVAMREKRPCEIEGYVVSPHLRSPGRWIRAHAAPILDDKDNPIGGVTVFSDITERVNLQKQRDCLATLIAHDIKNHLAAEQIFFDMLLQTNSAQFDQETLEILAQLRDGSNRFCGIADSLLEMSRARFFDQSHYGQELDVSVLIQRSIKLSALLATKHQVDVRVECAEKSPMIRGLPDVICQVFHNVIQNAVQMSPAGSRVSIRISAGDATAIVAVTDTGPGMSAEEVAQLFSPHRVAGHVAKTSHSSGFGLYLSAMLIEEHGGTMACKSELGKGTTISISMPVI